MFNFNKTMQLFLILGLTTCVGCTLWTFHAPKKGVPPTEKLIPQNIIDDLLNKSYTEKEKALILKDYQNIKNLCFAEENLAEHKHPVYIASAGGPGACKSTILESYLHEHNLTSEVVYADPDQRALKYMLHTYQQSLSIYQISKSQSFQDAQKQAYEKWRSASNYIANTIINEAFEKKYHIAHGTTSTSPTISSLYKKLKQQGYKIILLLCYAPTEMRIKALEYRANNQGFMQVAKDDIVTKGKLFPERFSIYFEYADEIHLYWTQDFLNGSIHAASYEKNKGFTVHDQAALDFFVKKYDLDRVESEWPSLDDLIK